MIIINEYFEGNVKSLGYQSADGKTTIGVIEKGEYEFGTSEHETMSVVEGTLTALLPGESDWQAIQPGESFEIEAGKAFKVQADGPVAYLCKYR